MKKVMYFVLAVALTQLLYSGDFRNAKWGMSKAQVEQTELLRPDSCSDYELFYSSTVSGIPCTVRYIFAKDSLVEAWFTFFPEKELWYLDRGHSPWGFSDSTNRNYQARLSSLIDSVYRTIGNIIVGKYGKPDWGDMSYRVVCNGDVMWWNTKMTFIRIEMDSPEVLVHYLSNELKGLATECERSRAIEKEAREDEYNKQQGIIKVTR